ncbi:MAG: DNA-3-methyladenine glycosylase [Psychroflexus salarius]
MNSDVVSLAKQLLGCYIHTEINGNYCSGIITETEAYAGKNDKACHAHLGRFTERTKVMYENGGIAYVYLCYGIHHLFNIVTNTARNADAILIRAAEPTEGVEHMLERRNKPKLTPQLTAGPGNFSKAFGITKQHNGLTVTEHQIWLSQGTSITEKDIVKTTRIGIDYAEEDALLHWRFYIKNSKYVSVK